MRWDYGNLYKKIRLDKHFTQKQVTSNTVSRTTLSRMENNKIQPSVETFEFLIDQIDVTFDEFTFLLNHNQPSTRASLVNRFFNSVSSLDVQHFLDLEKDCELYLKNHEDATIKDILSIVKAFLLAANTTNPEKDKAAVLLVRSVLTRLEKMDTWYFHELRLLNATLPFFSSEEVLKFLPKLLATLKNYDEFAHFESFKLIILINVSMALLRDGYLKECNEVATEDIHLSQKGHRYDFLAVAQIRSGICVRDKKRVSEGFQLIKLTHEDSLEDYMLAEIQRHWPEYEHE